MSNIQGHRIYITISKERNRCIERKYQTKARLNLIRALIKCCSSMANVERFRRLHPSSLAVYNVLLSHTMAQLPRYSSPRQMSHSSVIISNISGLQGKPDFTFKASWNSLSPHHTPPPRNSTSMCL